MVTMRPGAVAAFLTIDVVLVLTPGPDWAYVIAVGLRDRIVLPAVAGIVAGYMVLTVAVAAGLAVLIVTSPGALTAVTLVGAAYLIWLGVSVVSRLSESGPTAPCRVRPGCWASWPEARRRAASIRRPCCCSSPCCHSSSTATAGCPVAAQIAVLGAIHTANCAVAYLGLGTVARNALVRRPSAAYAVTRASGVAMIVLGGLLVVERALGWV